LKVRNAVQSDAICISRIGTNSGEFQHILAITIFGTTSWEIPGQTWAAQPDHSLVALAAPGVRLPGEDRVSLKKIGSRGCSNLRFYRWSTNFEQAIPTQQLSISCWLCPQWDMCQSLIWDPMVSGFWSPEFWRMPTFSQISMWWGQALPSCRSFTCVQPSSLNRNSSGISQVQCFWKTLDMGLSWSIWNAGNDFGSSLCGHLLSSPPGVAHRCTQRKLLSRLTAVDPVDHLAARRLCQAKKTQCPLQSLVLGAK
jgi:hypothetical protein